MDILRLKQVISKLRKYSKFVNSKQFYPGDKRFCLGLGRDSIKSTPRPPKKIIISDKRVSFDSADIILSIYCRV